MALLDIELRSEVLGLNTSINVIIPQKKDNDEKCKVLWLLHGLSANQTEWCRQTSIERYAENKNLCVIMPAVDRSFYTDMAYGNKYYTYVSEELPKIMADMFNFSIKKEDNYVAGLSMGGYGAFKLALNQPERFTAAASLSGALDIQRLFEQQVQHDEEILHQIKMVFGSIDIFKDSMNDLNYVAKTRRSDNLPNLYMCCGKEDLLYEVNLGYLDHLNNLNIPITFEQDEGYAHEWRYWDIKIQRVLEWMEI